MHSRIDQETSIKTAIATLSAATLLALGACAKRDGTAGNAASEQAATDVSVLGNDSGFASENADVPADNRSTAASDGIEPANTN